MLHCFCCDKLPKLTTRHAARHLQWCISPCLCSFSQHRVHCDVAHATCFVLHCVTPDRHILTRRELPPSCMGNVEQAPAAHQPPFTLQRAAHLPISALHVNRLGDGTARRYVPKSFQQGLGKGPPDDQTIRPPTVQSRTGPCPPQSSRTPHIGSLRAHSGITHTNARRRDVGLLRRMRRHDHDINVELQI
jgi:hypothetical protein